MAEDFAAKVKAQLQDLRAQDQQLAATQDGIERKRSDIAARINAYEASLRVYREVMGETAEVQPATGMFPERTPMGTIAEMAEGVIVRAGGRAKVVDILDALIDEGKIVRKPGRANYATVFSILNRDRRFRKLGDGYFTLGGST